MITKYIADQAVIGSTIIEALDGGLMLMYSSDDGKHFLKVMTIFVQLQKNG